jgi:hypothetical protein
VSDIIAIIADSFPAQDDLEINLKSAQQCKL